MQVGDIFSLMNLADGGVGCTLLSGRARGMLADRVQLIALAAPYAMRQTTGLTLPGSRERDPNLLALAAVCRSTVGRRDGSLLRR